MYVISPLFVYVYVHVCVCVCVCGWLPDIGVRMLVRVVKSSSDTQAMTRSLKAK
jgi:hypothetical protein